MTVPRGFLRAAFALYALALFIATHWPRLAIDSPVRGTDKVIHASVFCLWTLLLAGATSTPARRAPLGRIGLIAGVYACIDEGLQAIPALGRTCSWADLLANFGGVGIGLVILAISRRKVASAPLSSGQS
jgi:VanZ family protein